MTRTITPSDTNSAETIVTIDSEIAGVIFHESYAAQPGHRFEGKPYAAWTAASGHLPERFATVEAAADAIAPQDEAAEREARRAEVRSRPHVVSVRGGKVHIAQAENRDRYRPMCRDNTIGMFYVTTDRELTCLHCLGFIGER